MRLGIWTRTHSTLMEYCITSRMSQFLAALALLCLKPPQGCCKSGTANSELDGPKTKLNISIPLLLFCRAPLMSLVVEACGCVRKTGFQQEVILVTGANWQKIR